MEFRPERVLVEAAARSHPVTDRVMATCEAVGIPVRLLGDRQRPTLDRDLDQGAAYRAAKRVLVLSVRKRAPLQSCRPSAHWQLPLSSSCPGLCSYCYLQTRHGKRPFVRAYVNVEEILSQAAEAIAASGDDTSFEVAATSDPLPIEPYTGSLRRAIDWFGVSGGRLRLVTKYAEVDGLLDADHQGRTRFRVSLAPPELAARYEGGTPPVRARLAALARMAAAGYPVGLMVAPVFALPGWREAYKALLEQAARAVGGLSDLTLEFVTHRFTPRARDNIAAVFPDSGLPLDETEGRSWKVGQFGYGKWVYAKDVLEELRAFCLEQAGRLFPGAEVEYVV